MKRNIVVSLLLVLLTLFVVSCRDPKHEHTLEKIDAVAATCTSEGMMEYYKCSACNLVFADKDAETEVSDLGTLKTAKDPSSHAEVKKVDAVESTCTVNGTVEHWHCEGCGKDFGEASCETELDSAKAPLKAHVTVKIDAVESTCTTNGMAEHWHCEVCGKNFGDATCETELDSVEVKVHGPEDVAATGESFTVGGVEYKIYKCNHGNFFIDDACTQRIYKEYLDAVGFVVSEKNGVLDAYFSDCDVFMSTENPSSYEFQKAVAYFADKKFARLGYNNKHVGGMDATENKALTLTVTKDEDGNLHFTGGSEKDKKPFNNITSMTLGSDAKGNSIMVMVANGGETWSLKPYSNPLQGTYKDAAGNVLTFGRYVMKYTLSGEKAFYVADIDDTHLKVLSNETNSGAHRDTTFGFRQYVFLGVNLYIKWDVDLPGVAKWNGKQYYEYVPFTEE